MNDDDLTSLRQNLWYSDEELNGMKRRCQLLQHSQRKHDIQLAQFTVFMEQDEQRAVFRQQEQQQQHLQKQNDEPTINKKKPMLIFFEPIARAYRQCTKECQLDAEGMG